MNEPTKIKYFTKSSRLPSFEPSMEDILDVWEDYQRIYDAHPHEVFLEDISERCSQGGCSSCEGEGYHGCFSLVYSKPIPNENYESEMVIYRAEMAKRLKQDEEFRLKEIEDIKRVREANAARKAWKDSARRERISRRIVNV